MRRRPDFEFPIFAPLFLKEDVRHIERSDNLALAYQRLRDAIRAANRWDTDFRLTQARLRVADADLEPPKELVSDLLSSEADHLSPRRRWDALSAAAVLLLQAPARGIEEKVAAVRRGTEALREILARLDRYQYRDLHAMALNNLANALRELPARDAEERAGNVREAVGYYKEALAVRTRDAYPHDYAATAANLGMLLFEIGEVTEAKTCLEGAWALRDLLPDQGERIKSFLEGRTVPAKGKTSRRRRKNKTT